MKEANNGDEMVGAKGQRWWAAGLDGLKDKTKNEKKRQKSYTVKTLMHYKITN